MSSTAREAEAADSRVAILRAAYHAFGRHGVQRVSLEAIAEEAGVSKGLVLYHFKTRENLVLASMRWVLLEVADRIRRAVETAGTPTAKLDAMVEVIFSRPETNRRFYLTYLELVEHAARLQRFNELSRSFGSIQGEIYQDVVRSGVEAGAFHSADVERTASVMRAIIDGIFLQWLQDPDWRHSHAAYRESCLRALRDLLRV